MAHGLGGSQPRPLLRVSDLSKTFGRRVALESVSFAVESGEVIGLTGRRGAGKSTLLHLLAGVQAPTRGETRLTNRPLRLTDSNQAHRQGIELVPQKALLSQPLDIVSNIFLGRELGRLLPDWPRMTARARELLAALDMPASLLGKYPDALSDEERQVVMIARALCGPAQLILLDDALAALSFQRQEKFLALIKTLAMQGAAFIIASDNLKHLFAVTHRLLVLYEGRLVAERRTADCTPREIVELIVGSTRQEQVTPVIWALESYHTAQQQAEELRQLQNSLRASLEAQGSLNETLVQRLSDQVKALDQLNLALQSAQRRLLTEREEERKYLARELHDQTIQELLSFNYSLEELENEPEIAGWREPLANIRHGIRTVVGDLRQLCSDLRPPTIDSHGLSAALRSLTQSWAEKYGCTLTLDIDPQLGRLPEAIELSIFRIVQEGLSNIRKHATATHIALEVKRTPTANLLIRLSDNGRGLTRPLDLAALSAHKHFGLLGISERVALLGGSMKVESLPEGGARLHVEFPSPSPGL